MPFSLSSLTNDWDALKQVPINSMDLILSSTRSLGGNCSSAGSGRHPCSIITPGKKKSWTALASILRTIAPTCHPAICRPLCMRVAVRCASKSEIVSIETANPLDGLSFSENSFCRRRLGYAAFSIVANSCASSRFFFLSSSACFPISSALCPTIPACVFARCAATADSFAAALVSPTSPTVSRNLFEVDSSRESAIASIFDSASPILICRFSSAPIPVTTNPIASTPTIYFGRLGFSGVLIVPRRKSDHSSQNSQIKDTISTATPSNTNSVQKSNQAYRLARRVSCRITNPIRSK